MKKLLVSLVAVFFVAIPVFAGASSFRAGENYTLSKGEVIEGNFYAAGGDVILAGDVKGDISAVGGSLTMKGSVSGDVLLVGGTIILDGAVAGDTRIAGGTITISGTVGGDLIVAAGTTRVISGATIGGDVLLAGGSILFDGEVKGDVRFANDVAVLNGVIHGDAISNTERLTLGDKAVIDGVLTNHSFKKVVLAEGAVVRGGVVDEPGYGRGQGVRGMIAAVGVVGFLGFLLTGLICLWFFKNRSVQFTAHSLAHIGKEFLRGVICLIAVPVFGLILCITLVGAPIGILLILYYVCLMILAKVFAGALLGGWINKVIFKKPDQVFTWQTVIGGNVVLLALRFVPVIGGIICFIFTMVAFGVLWGYAHKHFWVSR